MGSSLAPLLVFPDPAPIAVAQGLDLAGITWKAVGNAAAAMGSEPEEGWAGAIICAEEDPDAAFSICRSIRRKDFLVEPLLLVISGNQLGALSELEDLFDDFCISPFHPVEFEARVRHGQWKAGKGTAANVVQYGDLALNVETYQAAFNGQPLDLTYMEYELLKFFVMHAHKVYTREQLLTRVWGYEYYGGARTVDVHVRRLRAKLGEEHAGLIQTVRSVGYRFGMNRWGSDAPEDV